MANNPEQPASVSSISNKHSVNIRLSSLVVAILAVLLMAISFYGGILFDQAQHKTQNSTDQSSLNRHFALGMLVYASNNSITIDSERTGAARSFKVTNKTLISVDGNPAKASDLKAGEICLIRIAPKDTAATILVNSHFTD